jgi:hypothetical protein
MPKRRKQSVHDRLERYATFLQTGPDEHVLEAVDALIRELRPKNPTANPAFDGTASGSSPKRQLSPKTRVD